MKPAHRINAVRIAIFAMALQALWPLISQAKPVAPGLLVPLCTIDGVTHYIDFAPGTSPLEKRSPAQHEHCQLCVFSGDRAVVLTPPSIRAIVIPVASTNAPERSAVASPESPSYPPAQPRAPPVLS